MAAANACSRAARAIEHWLEAERDQLPLWLPVLLGTGILLWFVLPDPPRWIALILGASGLAAAGVALSRGARAVRVLAVAGALVALGCALAWWRAERVAAPVPARPVIARFTGAVERIESLPARAIVRVTLAVQRVEADPGGAGRAKPVALPPRVRVNLAQADLPAGLGQGAIVRLRARLMPPAPPAVPGAYDFARAAWFQRLGATGRGFAPVEVVQPGRPVAGDLRAALSAHIRAQVPGSAGAIAATLATGDRGAIAEEDAEAMRRSGLAHLLSISGLHVTAVTGAAMLLILRLLALSPWAALHWRLPLIAAGAGAVAAVGYTLLTGAEVPTIRSCAAALLVLLAMALGREALTLRLVAAGALFVLLLWPETLMGPSFQLSFAAVTAIVALHESRRVRGWFAARDEGRGARLARGAASLLLTGLVVEIALMPIAMFHFHKAGIYGALANIVAIPLTTFVVMPLEGLALIADLVRAGAPFWWLAGHALDLLLWLAHATAGAPGSVAMLPGMPGGAFVLMAAGGLWIALWRTHWRWIGLAAIAIGGGWALATPPPDLIVTGDGRHLAIRTSDGGFALLRDRAGDYIRAMLGESGGTEEELGAIEDLREAECSPDLCRVNVRSGERVWRVAATRSSYLVPAAELNALCRSVDAMVSDRRLPRGCTPRWLKLDRAVLARIGGVAIGFRGGHVVTVHRPGDRHPWVRSDGK